MKKILTLLARVFIGSGIGQKLPQLHAAYKFFWKLANHDTKIFSIPFDLSFEISADTGPGLYLASKGEYEPFETQLFCTIAKSGDVVFDVGAHAGYYALISSRLVGEKGKVIAFEPSEQNISLLEKNIIKNKTKNIKIVKRAISNRTGLATFYLDPSSSGDNSLLPIDGAKGVEVNMSSIDSFIKESHLRPNILKIDVEGAEQKVIDGMTKALQLRSLRAIFCEFTPSRGDMHAAILFIISCGFEAKVIDEANQKIVPYTKKNANLIAQKHGYINILFQK